MKGKMIAAVATVAIVVGFSAMNVSAWGWGNGGHMMGYGAMYGTGATDAANQKFLDETRESRAQVAADRVELDALVAGPNPDSKRVRELSENIAANQLALQEKANTYGWNGGPANRHSMRGSGMGYGGYGGYGPCMW
ncbi:MAG: hypothetical protein VR65_21165 [Desulfobulbaceae bacterium BRH_c16a]|nr:MAG: hypothetical protein VR65_21165 [Desulfobulbaceae bacterium BRH_c16a]